ncbi:MAG: vitamin K epoxide reductase family protein [Candidatus Obscuribacterales bacterium]|nr:vitamin K epoxide reductase family protein [Candidatus Obscuribacterales bacterium]
MTVKNRPPVSMTSPPSQTLSERSRWLLPIASIAAIGLIDSAYLTYKHYAGGLVGCSAQAGCDDVLNSPFATIGDVPVALIGVCYYALAIGLAFSAASGSAKSKLLLKSLSISGMAASCYFVYLQLAVVNAICEYCMLSFGVTSILLLMIWLGRRPLGGDARPAPRSNYFVKL